MRLKRSFFDRDSCIVARELLGKKIVRVFDLPHGGTARVEAIITETEAYHGFEDKASHASRRKTERNKIMFDRPGLIYVYLIYGMHHCLNFTTMPKGFPAAVLIRAVALTESKMKVTMVNGPGKVCKALGIDRSFYGEDLAKSKRIWIESVGEIHESPKYDIIAGKRIGIDYAEECRDWEWNFRLKL